MALKNELRREREQILQQANKQRLELEQEIEKLKTDENYMRDRLALSLKVRGTKGSRRFPGVGSLSSLRGRAAVCMQLAGSHFGSGVRVRAGLGSPRYVTPWVRKAPVQISAAVKCGARVRTAVGWAVWLPSQERMCPAA